MKLLMSTFSGQDLPSLIFIACSMLSFLQKTRCVVTPRLSLLPATLKSLGFLLSSLLMRLIAVCVSMKYLCSVKVVWQSALLLKRLFFLPE